jgi:hypothetical protein
MARKSKDAVEGDNGPIVPDFQTAANLIQEIVADKSEAQKVAQDIGTTWKRIEQNCHVNRAAAQAALKISRMTDEQQSDYLRSLVGLMPHLNIGIRIDLVDAAEGSSNTFAIPTKGAPVSELAGD